jgi:hypothetical protein
MPPGLTASLEREEFIDLVGYLSKLGSSGDFRVTNEKFVRTWYASTDTDAVRSLLSGAVASEAIAPVEKGRMPLYSRVAGGLPLEEIPVLKDVDGREYGLLTFEVEVLGSGTLTLGFNSIKALRVWVGTEELSLTSTEASTMVDPGKHRVQVVLDLGSADQEFLRIQVLEDGKQSSQNRLVTEN